MQKSLTSLIITILMPSFAFAATLHVPGDYHTIQEAINASVNGDTIVIAAGTYYEHSINPGGKAIQISGEVDANGMPATAIDAQGQGSVVRCTNNETSNTMISDLVLSHGNPGQFGGFGGGGAEMFGASPTFKNCTFAYNEATQGNEGGGAFCFNASNPRFENCRFIENHSDGFGGGLSCSYYSTATLIDCVFTGNSGCYGGAVAVYECDMTIIGCKFVQNSSDGYFCGSSDGGAIYNYEGNISISDCEFRENSASGQGGAIYGNPVASSSISGSFFCENEPADIFGPWTNGGGNDFNPICPIMDSDDDGVDDAVDNCELFNPEQLDCNTNGIGDVCDIEDGTSQDLDGNGIPDECECITDITDGTTPGNPDGLTDVNDVLALIGQWDETESFADINNDGIVNVNDMLILLDGWGDCL